MLAASDIFAGPIVRRSSPPRIAVWLATTKPVELDGLVRKAGTAEWIGQTTTVDRIKLFDGLFAYLVQIAPAEDHFPTGTLLEYSLGTVGKDGEADHSWFKSVVAEDGLAYPGFELPTLYLQAAGAKLNVLYGSCRKPHDIDGGDNDALAYGDSLVLNNVTTLAARPTILCLAGDQIYADDVHDATFDAINTVATKLEGSTPEKMPNGATVPGRGQRLKWTTDKAGFTSGEAANHLVTFAEYVAHYGLAWNRRNWPTVSVAKEVVSYRDGLPAVRRLMANTPTYMMFDDHDVTDDWNFSINWAAQVKSSAVGTRIITNALAAYWIFQAWGNDPKVSARETPHMRDALAKRLTDPAELETVVGTKSTLNEWEFQTPTIPVLYFLDTRTNRGYKDDFKRADGGEPAFLKSAAAWLPTRDRLNMIVDVQQRSVPLVLVTAAPVFGFETIDSAQMAVSGKLVPTSYFDLEGWAANRAHLFLFLTLCRDHDVVVLSGDVHYAFTSTASFAVFDAAFVRGAAARVPGMTLPGVSGSTATNAHLYTSRFVQLNSSGTRNSVGGWGKTKMMSGMANNQGESGYMFAGNPMSPEPARFKNGRLYTPITVMGVTVWRERDLADVQPNFVYQQRINDPGNTRFINKHNLGYAQFLGRKVQNGFLVDGKLDPSNSTSFDFGSGAAWTPAAP